MKTYTPTIGIEVHAELKTNTKMFCASKNAPHQAEPNVHVCPICMGHPGTLPVINKKAVQHVVRVGTAIGGEIATYTEFDRKNYFYPDIPKGYQISQYEFPLVKGGELAGVKITRVHLEEDTARSLHDVIEGSIVDYNRAGVPLMELVTEPVIHDAKTAGNFARELQLLLRTLGVSDANMEKGEMRVEANISVSDSMTFGTKVEVKNLNSFRSVEGAIEYEIKRQIGLIESGEKVVQETRGWDEIKGKTYSQRVKESANDYRYFPDPDLPKLSVKVSDFISDMPELPEEKRAKYRNLGLTREQIEMIISDKYLFTFYDATVSDVAESGNLPRLVANYLLTDLLPTHEESAFLASAYPSLFGRLIKLVDSGEIGSRVAKDILIEVAVEGKEPESLIAERGLGQVESAELLQEIVNSLITEHPSVVNEYKSGKENALQFLVGQGMKKTKGAARPQTLLEMLKQTLA